MMVTRMMVQHPNIFGVFFKWRTSVWLFIKVCIFPASGWNFRLWWRQQRKRQHKVYVFNPVGQRLELFSFDLTGSRESKHVRDVERNKNVLQTCKASAFRVVRLKERVLERTEQDANVAMMLAAAPQEQIDGWTETPVSFFICIFLVTFCPELQKREHSALKTTKLCFSTV